MSRQRFEVVLHEKKEGPAIRNIETYNEEKMRKLQQKRKCFTAPCNLNVNSTLMIFHIYRYQIGYSMFAFNLFQKLLFSYAFYVFKLFIIVNHMCFIYYSGSSIVLVHFI